MPTYRELKIKEAGEIVSVGDPRFASHAARHASGGADPVTLAQSQVTNLTTDLAAKAPLASPALTGTPTVPTASAGTNTTQAASTAFVVEEVRRQAEILTIAVSDEATAITTGTAKVTLRAPFAMTLTAVPRASLSTASSSGLVAVDINEAGVSILGTDKLSIDANERTSTTAATATTLADTTIADDAEITIDIDSAGTGAKGLKVTLYFRRT